jgi:diaminopimelate decarboxylase
MFLPDRTQLFISQEYQMMSHTFGLPRLWWERDDLGYRNRRLFSGNQDLQVLAESSGTPTYAYNAARIQQNLMRLSDVLATEEIQFKIFYALKANRHLPLVTSLKLRGQCGADVCSPGELLLARQAGFHENEITYTGTSVSDEDIECLKRHPGVRVNCDAISTLKRLGAKCPGRSVGIRINPQRGAGYHAGLHYAGSKTTKFGIYKDRFLEALEVAGRCGLNVKTLHFHIGSGYGTNDLNTLDEILVGCHWFLDQCPEINTLDIGGGLGVPLVEGQEPLDLDAWSKVIAKHANRRGLEIHLEPGDYLVKDAGVLLLQVNTVEEKGGKLFVGVNGGFNIQNLAAYYQTPFIVAPLEWRPNRPKEKITLAGNINEAIDILAEDIELPSVSEGDYLALLNTGGYGSASSSNHCMRGKFSEYLLIDEQMKGSANKLV